MFVVTQLLNTAVNNFGSKFIGVFPKCFHRIQWQKCLLTVKGFEPATSCVRDQGVTTAPARHMWETGSLNWAPIASVIVKVAEFSETAPLGKTRLQLNFLTLLPMILMQRKSALCNRTRCKRDPHGSWAPYPLTYVNIILISLVVSRTQCTDSVWPLCTKCMTFVYSPSTVTLTFLMRSSNPWSWHWISESSSLWASLIIRSNPSTFMSTEYLQYRGRHLYNHEPHVRQRHDVIYVWGWVSNGMLEQIGPNQRFYFIYFS